jgi:hypothetical protein
MFEEGRLQGIRKLTSDVETCRLVHIFPKSAMLDTQTLERVAQNEINSVASEEEVTSVDGLVGETWVIHMH